MSTSPATRGGCNRTQNTVGPGDNIGLEGRMRDLQRWFSSLWDGYPKAQMRHRQNLMHLRLLWRHWIRQNRNRKICVLQVDQARHMCKLICIGVILWRWQHQGYTTNEWPDEEEDAPRKMSHISICIFPSLTLYDLDCQKGEGKRKLAYEDESEESEPTTGGSEPLLLPLQNNAMHLNMPTSISRTKMPRLSAPPSEGNEDGWRESAASFSNWCTSINHPKRKVG